MTPALSIRDLTVTYGEKPALWDIDLDFEPGSLTAVVGPNGAGKSTLLKAVLGLLPKVAGTVLAFGAPIADSLDRIAYVPQRSAVDWDFPTDVLDVAMMGAYRKLGWFRRPGAAERAKALECLDRLGIADLSRRQISQLSGGQQQRVFLARALVQDPDLFLLDEPLAGVDVTTEERALDLFRQLQGQGKTVIVVHHDLETVRDVFDRAVLLNVRLVANGPVRDVMEPAVLRKAYLGGRDQVVC
ncbi:MAG: metal ABC transporter ATP-binding protein [Fimbriimonadaceae bacterium]|nr:metal ABC transporter ATP-binding protein [Fimbriimonadaceae bacterium]QYK58818.1 MAG: metal ABC transporter ATP-binding protein [Fimbriimonadaceae bacterium]